MRSSLHRLPTDRDLDGQPAAMRTKAGTLAPFVRRWPGVGLGLGERRPPMKRLSERHDVPRESRIVLRGLNLR
jgi:hypothetical protein